MLAGSVPPGNEALWQAARSAGFDTTLLRRVQDDAGKLVEQAVDEVIHLKIANLLLDAPQPGIIVLGTGDGATTDQGSSFTRQVLRAVARGWEVEVWSWEESLSDRLRDAKLRHPDQVRIMSLDTWYEGVIFIKAGTWETSGVTRAVAGRTCSGLDLTEQRFRAGTMFPGAEVSKK